MAVEIRRGETASDDEELVIRAGGGSVEALVDQAVAHAVDYWPLVDAGVIRSPYDISVNLVRSGVATSEQLLSNVPYNQYKPYLAVTVGTLRTHEHRDRRAPDCYPTHALRSFGSCRRQGRTDRANSLDPCPVRQAHQPVLRVQTKGAMTMSETMHFLGYTRLLADRTAGLPTIRADMASVSSSGHGLMPEPVGIILRAGDRFAITDDDANTLLAEVLADPSNGTVEIKIHWDTILAYAQ